MYLFFYTLTLKKIYKNNIKNRKFAYTTYTNQYYFDWVGEK